MQIRRRKLECYYKKYFTPLWAPCRELPILPTEGRGMFIFYRDRNKGLSNAFLLCKYCVIYSLFFLVCTFRLKSTSCLILTGSNQLRKGTKSMFVWVTNYEKLGIWNHSSRDKEGFLLGRYVGWNLNDWQGGKEMVPHWLRVLQRRFWKIFFYIETKCKSWGFVLSLQFDYEVSALTWEYDMFNFKDGLVKHSTLS